MMTSELSLGLCYRTRGIVSVTVSDEYRHHVEVIE